ncbi:alpha/beta hydrolase fold-domain-containing protein [Xylariaceae sp. FL0594]|nr:alpha/beta hydrolase fold-domain-containing protein [Xylariaceae sp. FL0594]
MSNSQEKKNDDGLKVNKSQNGLLWMLLPKLPMIMRVVLLHILRISESSRYLDLRSDVTLNILRSFMDSPRPRPVGKTQAMTLTDPGIKGRIWVSKVASQVPPETSVRDALVEVIRALSDDEARATGFNVPDVVPVEAEWTGYRAGVPDDAPLPDISEEEKYAAMMRECGNGKRTLLYFHGGAYYLCDPATHRPLVKQLAKLTGGRVYSVRYRLAPQNPFPAALLDALVSYLALLYPPPGSIHEPVSASDIVFGGDSAGGNLTLVLTQTLLQLRRRNVKIAWFGAEREVPLPAAITLNSPWLDLAQSLPSWADNQKWDYLPAPKRLEEAEFPEEDGIWPPGPGTGQRPRRHLFVDDCLLLHPLVSAHLAQSWAGAPPTWVCCGWECLADEDRYLVAKLRRDGVRVAFEEYEAMPHVFAAVIPRARESRRCLDSWAKFIVQATEKPDEIESRYTCIKAKTLEESEGDVAKLTPYAEKDVFDIAYGRLGREVPVPLFSSKL